jgi:hypothetical protein
MTGIEMLINYSFGFDCGSTQSVSPATSMIRAVPCQLLPQRVQDDRWDVGRLLEERAEESNRGQLQRES